MHILKRTKATPALLALALTIACGSDGKEATPQTTELHKPDSVEVIEMMNLYITGDYEGYVDMMESLDDKPDDYRAQMAALMKQRHRSQEEAHGGPVQARLQRIELTNDGRYAKAFIEMVYNDRAYDEILVPLVFKDGRWRLR